MTQIEEEIKKAAFKEFPIINKTKTFGVTDDHTMEYDVNVYARLAFIYGARWMKEFLKNEKKLKNSAIKTLF